MLSSRLGSRTGALSHATSALVSCAALFEELQPVIAAAAAETTFGTSGIRAAAAVYEQALAAVPYEVRQPHVL